MLKRSLLSHKKFRTSFYIIVLVLIIAGTFYILWIQPRLLFRDDYKFSQLSPSKQRAILHKILSLPGMHHDAFISLIHIGDETSVPYLVKSVKWQKPSSGGSWPCSAAHCAEAFQTITNNYPGDDYQDWVAWWKENKGKTRRQWILQGFTQNGLLVSDPPDDSFICALLEILIDTRKHYVNHAWSILTEVSKDQLMNCIDLNLSSGSDSKRKGAEIALSKLEK